MDGADSDDGTRLEPRLLVAALLTKRVANEDGEKSADCAECRIGMAAGVIFIKPGECIATSSILSHAVGVASIVDGDGVSAGCG